MHGLVTRFVSLLLLLILRNNILVESIHSQEIQKEVEKFGKTCVRDKCKQRDYSLSDWNCHCGKHCVQLGTCCLESPYADVPQPKKKPTCRSVYSGKDYFIVDDCPSDSAWASLCYGEWNKDEDIQKLVPVTSNSTSITYKNFFCFRCHETHDNFLFWSLMIQSNNLQPSTHNDVAKSLDKERSFTYNKENDTWMVTYDENIGYFPVIISVRIPFDLYNLTQHCVPYVIATCDDKWHDDEVRNKCHSYMALREVRRDGERYLYKNVHCALCNSEDLGNVFCRGTMRGGSGQVPLSFAHLLDINPSGGNRVGVIQKCADGEFWDNLSKKCRKLSCLQSGYSVKNDKCVKK